MAPLLAVVFDLGSATAMDVGLAAEGLCDLVFVCDPSSAHVGQAMPVLEDFGTVVSLGDVDRVAATLRAMGAEGIVAFGDHELAAAAAIAGRLGLPYHSPETAAVLTDKHLQRARLAAEGVDAIRFAIIARPDEAEAAARVVGAPAVLKPRRGSGSRNTTLVRTPEECAAAAAEAFRLGEEALVLEELLTGDERVAGEGWGDYVSVESLACGDDVFHLGVTGKPPLAEPFRETGAFFPSTLPQEVAERAFAVTADALRAAGVRHGVCHTELKLTPSGSRVIEVNGRLGGYVDDVMSRSTGLSPLRLALAAALGRAGAVERGLPECVAYQLFALPPVGARSVADVRGVDAARRLPGVLRVEVTRGPGDAVDWREGTASTVATVHGEAPDHAALLRVRRSLAELLVVDYRD
jgi:biotin carboxylase